jgi:hypothetical protein
MHNNCHSGIRYPESIPRHVMLPDAFRVRATRAPDDNLLYFWVRPKMQLCHRLFPLALIAFGLAGGAVHATDAPMCRNGLFADKDTAFGLARITGAPRTFLRLDTGQCPDASEACKQPGYVIPGDTVITADSSGDYTCVYFQNKAGGSAGYIRRDEFKPLPAPKVPAVADWAGRWRDGDNDIRLKVQGQSLYGTGSAYWPSANPSLKLRPGGPNVGSFEGVAPPRGAVLEFSEGEMPAACVVRLRLVGRFLLASDNRQCGGANVSFTGVYSRAK